jgi:hypothetical protein
MHLHVGVATSKAEAAPAKVLEALEKIRGAQQSDPAPPQLGRAIGQAPVRA